MEPRSTDAAEGEDAVEKVYRARRGRTPPALSGTGPSRCLGPCDWFWRTERRHAIGTGECGVWLGGCSQQQLHALNGSIDQR